MPLLHSRFPHHRLHAYRDALALHQGVEAIARRFPVGHADLEDQLRRAAAATVRNIVEAASRYHPRDKAARYITARGECAECEVSLEMAEAILPDEPRRSCPTTPRSSRALRGSRTTSRRC